MPLSNPKPGFNLAAEYQVSGLPHVISGTATTAPTVIEFAHVSNAISIVNNSANTTYLRVGFTSNGVNGANCFLLQGGGNPHRVELRVRDLWVRADTGTVSYCVLGELTTIPRSQMLPLSGSTSADSGSLVWPGIG